MKSSSPTLNMPTASRTARAIERAPSRLGRSSAKMTRDEVTFLETGAQWVARLASARRLRRLSRGLGRSDRSANRGLLRRLLVHDVGQACVGGCKSGLRGRGSGLVRRVREVVLQAMLVGFGL